MVLITFVDPIEDIVAKNLSTRLRLQIEGVTCAVKVKGERELWFVFTNEVKRQFEALGARGVVLVDPLEDDLSGELVSVRKQEH